MEAKELVYKKLDELGIKYEIINHKAAYTIEDIAKLNFPSHIEVCKNLFMCNGNKTKYYLIIVPGHKRVDAKVIAHQIDSTHLSFASAEDLYKYLKLKQGEVTPFGIFNDAHHEIEIVIDKSLINHSHLGFHPNDNTATVIISFNDLENIIKQNNNIHYVNI